ncbi:TetR/AcrR family transcriptional regulator [Pseudonocardia acaciae]|uniref:TetR/AcrR family transcriptional regulator n=1 Tax=Pseudonocardia acaciae TaxID=551276 RepID=UPI001B805330|nr:TetR/AcrR family transcriptional regulator [Pseudonocardia acaciae]
MARQPGPPRRTSAQTREHILQVAHELFYWRGIRATGVDTVAAEAGIAPTTLYRLFDSKDDLVAAYVERAGEEQRRRILDAVADDGRHPRERIMALFDVLEAELPPSSRCRGCVFLMTLTEVPDQALPAHRHAVAMKAWIRATVRALTAELANTTPVDDPTLLADRLVLVMEGFTASAHALGPDGPAGCARALAEHLLDQASAAGSGRGTG